MTLPGPTDRHRSHFQKHKKNTLYLLTWYRKPDRGGLLFWLIFIKAQWKMFQEKNCYSPIIKPGSKIETWSNLGKVTQQWSLWLKHILTHRTSGCCKRRDPLLKVQPAAGITAHSHRWSHPNSRFRYDDHNSPNHLSWDLDLEGTGGIDFNRLWKVL